MGFVISVAVAKELKKQAIADCEAIAEQIRRHVDDLPTYGGRGVSVVWDDKEVCEHCGSPSDLNVDHIIPRRAGGTHHPDNLQILCSHCHGKKTGLEAHQWPFSQFPTFKEQRRYNGGMF